MGVYATNVLVLWLTHADLLLNGTQSHSFSSHGHNVCLEEVTGMLSHFFKPPQSYRIVVLWLITPPLPLERSHFLSAFFSVVTFSGENWDWSSQKWPGCWAALCWYVSFSSSCKAIGKTEKQPGSSKTDVVCGLHSPGRSDKMLYMCDLRKLTDIEIICIVSSSMIVLLEGWTDSHDC